MIICSCFIQAGQISAEVERRLRDRFESFTQQAFGESAQINWVPVAKGSGFSAGKPSTSSVVSVRANAPLEQPTRVKVLKQLSELWIEITGCSFDELLVVVADPDQ